MLGPRWEILFVRNAVDGKKSCDHELGLVVEIPLFTTGELYIPGGCLGFLNHQQ